MVQQVKNTALVFPGQGSQQVGMLNDFAAKFPTVAKHVAQASAILNYDLWEIISVGPAEKLNQTIYTQPAMLVADVCMWKIWCESSDKVPAFVAGHSLGEYAALVAAGAIEFTDAVALVDKRAHFMQEAVSVGEGAMAVVLKLPADEVIKVCEQVSGDNDQVVQAVNFNSPQQTVIAGHAEAVEQAMLAAKEAGAKLVKKLPVSVPSHCILMQPAAEKLMAYLADINIEMPKIPVINNVDVKVCSQPDEIRDALVRQLCNPVRWVETIEYMVQNGVETIVECGPGKVLTGLNKRINPELDLQKI